MKRLFSKFYAARERQRFEDALKALLDAAQSGQPSTTDTMAKALDISRASAERLAESMRAQGLLTMDDDRLVLAPEGQRWAIQVTRAHRLWERYLADEARMPLKDVHRVAHQREHTMTAGQIDALDAALGYPSRDPHGDPIPDASGSLRTPSAGVPLDQWKRGLYGKIIHLEDEPPVAFAQLIAAGLHPGQTVAILENTPQRVLLSDGENEIPLAPAIAANISLQLLEQAAVRPQGAIPLSRLETNASAEIIAIDERCQGFTRRRFLDLGLTPGTRIHPELENAFGEPRAYRVRGSLIALRNEQAALILVRPQPAA